MILENPDGADASDPAYAFKPSLIGAMCRFALKPDGMYWEIGRRRGVVGYDRVEAVRLSYRPVTMQSHRFITELWSPDSPKIQIASVSMRSMMEQERLDKTYSAFVAELHRRIAAAGGQARFSTGLPVLVYWIGALAFAGVLLATAVLIVRALRLGQWSAAGVVGAIFLVFAVQIGNYFRRNRPGRYSPERIPPAVLPKS